MLDIAKTFVKFKKEKNGDDAGNYLHTALIKGDK